MTGVESLLCCLLECGTLDLGILDYVGYDLGEIVEDLQYNGIKPTLNIITGEIFYRGQQDLIEKLEEKISELESERDEYEEDSEEYVALQEQIDELKFCDPKKDVKWFCNCLDTSVWFSDNEEIYMKYLADEIAEIEDDMGFNF